MRVLVVEDDPSLSLSLKQGLGEAGYAVDLALNGRDGLDLARLEHYDLLVVDVMLPELSGLDLCRTLRSEGRDMPLLLLTALGSLQDRVLGLDSGSDDYLVKPFALAELLARMRALLRRPGGRRDPILRAGPIRLDPATRTVMKGEERVDLANKEFQLLEYLMRNCGRLVTRREIVDHLWDYDTTVSSNLVDVYIVILRRKLGDARFLRTVRGAGYQLVDG